jgi:DNA-binding NarL/FixJ family response regulator
MSRVTRVVLVDDHHLMLKATTDLIDEDPRMEVVGTSLHGRDLMELIAGGLPDVILMDLGGLGEFDPFQVMEQLNTSHPSLKILVLSGSENPVHLNKAIKSGACGYLLKDDPSSQNIPEIIQIVSDGGRYFSPRLMDVMLTSMSGLQEQVNKRELELLCKLDRGMSNSSIADELHISIQTVKNLLTVLYRKLGVDNRYGAVTKARQIGLISGDPPASARM